MKPTTVLIDRHPGRSAQSIGLARAIGTDPDLIHEPSVGVVGTKGDSQCYLGVMAKVEAIHAQLKSRVGQRPGPAQAAPGPARVHDRDLRRHPQRHARDALLADRPRGDERRAVRASERHRPRRHDRGRGLRQAAGRHARRAARAQPAVDHHVGRPDPSRARIPRPARRSISSAPTRSPAIPTPRIAHHIACHACPGIGSCGGMFTYNTMQTFIGVVGMQPLHMVAPPSDDPRRVNEFAGRAGRPSGEPDGEGPQAARHRRARFDPQRDDRGDGDRRLDQRDPARAGDRARRGLRRLLEGHHDAGGVQLPLAACRPGAHRRAALRQVFDGRHRQGRRRAGDRARAARRRTAERRRADLHRRDARPPRSSASARSRPTARSSIPSRSPTSRPAACACWAATCRRTSRRSSSSPASKAAWRTTCSAARHASSRASRRCSTRSTRRPSASRTTTWSSCATRGRAARRACPRCSIRPRASRRCAASATSSWR